MSGDIQADQDRDSGLLWTVRKTGGGVARVWFVRGPDCSGDSIRTVVCVLRAGRHTVRCPLPSGTRAKIVGRGGADEKLTPEGGNITYAKEHDELVEPIPEKRTRKKQDESLAFRKMLVHQA